MVQGIASKVVQAYEIIGQQYAARPLDSLYNDYYERPVMYSLLGDVEGKRVLDAGCGPGSYAAWLVSQGADVVAIDASPEMVTRTKARLGGSFQVHLADLNGPLSFVEAGAFDLVLCALVLDYIEDWEAVLAEFGRVLVAGGCLVFSVHHPFFLDLKVDAQIEDSYFSTQLLEEDWRLFGLTIPAYRRPLGAMTAALWKAGFVIEQIVEPLPTAECKVAYPEHYEQLSRHPVFLCFRVRRKR
jgi:SAM-dependent methyltransferase